MLIFYGKSRIIFFITILVINIFSCRVKDKKIIKVNESSELSNKKSSSDSIAYALYRKQQERIAKMKTEKYPFIQLLSRKANINYEQLKENVIFLNFGFSSCMPCISELKGLSILYKKLSVNSNFTFISLTFDDKKTIGDLVAKYNLPFIPISISREDCVKLNLGNGYPTNIIIDQKGNIKEIRTSGFPSEEKSTEYILKNFIPLIEEILHK